VRSEERASEPKTRRRNAREERRQEEEEGGGERSCQKQHLVEAVQCGHPSSYRCGPTTFLL